ncbi:unnamed protein product [Prunus armeniaca]
MQHNPTILSISPDRCVPTNPADCLTPKTRSHQRVAQLPKHSKSQPYLRKTSRSTGTAATNSRSSAAISRVKRPVLSNSARVNSYHPQIPSKKSCLKIATRYSSKDVNDTINVLSDEKKAAIEEMGFVSLLKMKCGKLSHSMCRFLVYKLNPCESSIVLHGKTLKISVDDFVPIMSVKDGGEEVDFTGSMDEQHIVKMVVGTEEAGDFFKVGFAMFALCTLLCPTTSVSVLPLTVWGKIETEKIKKWLQKMGWFESDKVVVTTTKSGGLRDYAKTMTHFAEELSLIRKDVATLVATVARMNESLSKVYDRGQVDPGNTKRQKIRTDKQDGTRNDQGDNVKGFTNLDKTFAPSIEVIREKKHAKQPYNEV